MWVEALALFTFMGCQSVRGFAFSPKIAHGPRRPTVVEARCSARRGMQTMSATGDSDERFLGNRRECSRADMLRAVAVAASAAILGPSASWAATEEPPKVGRITKSGVKYFDYKEGEGEPLKWGKVCSMRFTFWAQESPESKLVFIDKSDNNKQEFLFKHGNGRQIKGLEEGVHSMRVGGRRRILVPLSLGYTVPGLGPFPAGWRERDTLNKMLDTMGPSAHLVFDVEVLDAFDDEADLGYYDDETPTLEQLEEIIIMTNKFLGGEGELERLPGSMGVLPASEMNPGDEGM